MCDDGKHTLYYLWKPKIFLISRQCDIVDNKINKSTKLFA